MKHYELEPEVPGGLGDNTILDRSTHPPAVSRLHLIFEGWMGDQLLEVFPCFVVTATLGGQFEAMGLTGFRLENFAVVKGDQFDDVHPGLDLPPFRWMKINGKRGVDDVFLTETFSLGVTQRALDIIQTTLPTGLGMTELE